MKLRTLLLGVGVALWLVTAHAVEPQVYFSRTDPVAKVLAREIDAAQKSIHLLVYSLTDDDLAAALIRAGQRGVDVRIVIDRTQAAGKSSLDERLLEKLGPQRVLYRTGKGRGVMHEKMAIYDGLTVSLGSYNWTANARDNNWENLILLRDAAIAARCTAEFQRVWNSPAPKESKPKAKVGAVAPNGPGG
jgi:phosphatidylserine/phosphatidylglycerophosphate/cardiolipin synthase-like enzyme